MSTPECSCHLPWAVASIALLMFSGTLLQSVLAHATPTPAPGGSAAVEATRPAAMAALQHDLDESRRVLDDAQSGLAQRDRELSAANDEVRRLREELAAARAKAKDTTTP